MPSTVPKAGTLQIAAALVFHLPGARLELTSPSGHRCSIGPMTDPRCTLHPAEFRELVLAAGNGQMLGKMLGFALTDEPTLTLTSSGIDMDHLGGGLYRVAGCETTSFAFTTSLPASQVDQPPHEPQQRSCPRACRRRFGCSARRGSGAVRKPGAG